MRLVNVEETPKKSSVTAPAMEAENTACLILVVLFLEEVDVALVDFGESNSKTLASSAK